MTTDILAPPFACDPLGDTAQVQLERHYWQSKREEDAIFKKELME